MSNQRLFPFMKDDSAEEYELAFERDEILKKIDDRIKKEMMPIYKGFFPKTKSISRRLVGHDYETLANEVISALSNNQKWLSGAFKDSEGYHLMRLVESQSVNLGYGSTEKTYPKTTIIEVVGKLISWVKNEVLKYVQITFVLVSRRFKSKLKRYFNCDQEPCLTLLKYYYIWLGENRRRGNHTIRKLIEAAFM